MKTAVATRCNTELVAFMIPIQLLFRRWFCIALLMTWHGIQTNCTLPYGVYAIGIRFVRMSNLLCFLS
jgi:hypothetical protein